MRNWRELIKALTSSPRGWSADGRVLGLGLATAMERQRARAAEKVAHPVHHEAGEVDRREPVDV